MKDVVVSGGSYTLSLQEDIMFQDAVLKSAFACSIKKYVFS